MGDFFCLFRSSDGRAISFSSRVPDPVPPGLEVVRLGADFSVLDGKRWDPTTRGLVDDPSAVNPVEALRGKDPASWTAADRSAALRYLLFRV